MEILGIGPSELLFIVLLAIIILGPRDMQRAGRSIGRWLRQVVTSDGWRLFQQTSREIQTLPNRLMRESALEDMKETGKGMPRHGTSATDADQTSLTRDSSSAPEDALDANRIAPPSATPSSHRDPEENA